MSRNLFITGTGTDVGKTYVAGLIVKKLADSGSRAAYYKAAMSGNIRQQEKSASADVGSLIPGDAAWVKDVSGISQDLDSMCPYVYEHAYSPHLAAKVEGGALEMDVVRRGFEELKADYEFVTVEGSGGIVCPLRFDEQHIQLEDVIQELHLPCLIVADAGLGTINSVVLTVEYMRKRNMQIKGLIFNNFHDGNIMEEDNIEMCKILTGVEVLACVSPRDRELDMDAEVLKALYE